MEGDERANGHRAREPAQGDHRIEQLPGGESVPQQPDVEGNQERPCGPAGGVQHPPGSARHTAAGPQDGREARPPRKPAGLETTHRRHYSDETDRRQKDPSAAP
jgi:hypothetical protein